MERIKQTITTLNVEFLGNPAHHRILAGIVYLIALFGLKAIVKFGVKRIDNIIKDKKTSFWTILLQEIEEIPKYFYIIIEMIIPLKLLKFPETIEQIINGILMFVVLIQIIQLLNSILVFGLKGMFTKQGKLEKTTLNAIKLITKVTLRIIGGIFMLSNLGIEVSPLLASLGIGGLAVAFAAQNMLQDLFSSFSIIISKPFKVGDYIKIDEDHMGSVNNITLKATHITSIKGHDIRIPNKDVLNGSLENFGVMKHRRIRFDIGVAYHTPTKLLKKIPQIIEDIISEYEGEIMFEWARMSELGEYSIKFKISYVLKNTDYQEYLIKNEAISFAILEKFEKEKIEIAYPTQTIITETKKK